MERGYKVIKTVPIDFFGLNIIFKQPILRKTLGLPTVRYSSL